MIRCPKCNFLIMMRERFCPYCGQVILQPQYPYPQVSKESKDIIKNYQTKVDIKNINLKWITICARNVSIPAGLIEGLPLFLEKGDKIKAPDL